MSGSNIFGEAAPGTAHPQATVYPDFALNTLGWKAFQDLIGTIGKEVLGQTFQQFLPSNDAGRDGAFYGTWKAADNAVLSGHFTAQCKFTNRANATLSLSDLKDEIPKARELASKGLAKNYLLFTNFGVSGRTDADLRTEFGKIPGIEVFLTFGHDWIVQQMRSSMRLRMLVPRVYGLGDLSQILDDRQYRQAREILSSMQQDLARFVITEAYKKSANAILNHGFVFLLGEPASGKSTIAAGPPFHSSQLPRVPRPCRVFCDRAGILTSYPDHDSHRDQRRRTGVSALHRLAYNPHPASHRRNQHGQDQAVHNFD